MEKGQTFVPIIKNGPKRHLIGLSSQGRQILKRCESRIATLKKGKKDGDNIIYQCSNKGKKPLIDENYNPKKETYFGKSINRLLEEASQELGKHIRSHSFRITLITDVIESNSL